MKELITRRCRPDLSNSWILEHVLAYIGVHLEHMVLRDSIGSALGSAIALSALRFGHGLKLAGLMRLVEATLLVRTKTRRSDGRFSKLYLISSVEAVTQRRVGSGNTGEDLIH